MSVPLAAPVVDRLFFAEGPRWYENRLWFSDMFGHRVMRVDGHGAAEVVADLPDDSPSGLGWLPDGRLLVVGMTSRTVHSLDPGGLVVHADLAPMARGMTNDMIVARDGTAYVGDSGLPPFGHRAERLPGQIIRVQPDGRSSLVAHDLVVPNGMILTPDERTLIVAESHAARLTAFDILDDGALANRRIFAHLAPPDGGTQPVHPDGICLDAEGAVWAADLTYRQVVRVHEGGRVSARIEFEQIPIACVLGGPDRTTLFVCVSEHTDITRLGSEPVSRVLAAEVSVPGAGRP